MSFAKPNVKQTVLAIFLTAALFAVCARAGIGIHILPSFAATDGHLNGAYFEAGQGMLICELADGQIFVGEKSALTSQKIKNCRSF